MWSGKFAEWIAAWRSLATLVGLAAFANPAAANPEASEASTLFLPFGAANQLSTSVLGALRVDVSSERRLRVAEQFFDEGETAVAVALPERLGGGFLFHQRFTRIGGLSTRLYLAHDFTGELQPWGILPFPVERVVPGFDRLYFLSPGRAVAASPSQRGPLALDPLPQVPSYLGLQVLDDRVARLPSPPLGVLETIDAGKTWRLAARNSQPATAIAASPPRSGDLLNVLQRAVDEGVCLVDAGEACAEIAVLTDAELWYLERARGELRLTSKPRRDSFGQCRALVGSHQTWWCISSSPTVVSRLVSATRQGPRLLAQLDGSRVVLATAAGKALVRGGCSSGDQAGLCLVGGGLRKSIGAPPRAPLALGTDGREVFGLYRAATQKSPRFELVNLATGVRQRFEASPDPSLLNLAEGHVVGSLHFDGQNFGFWLSRGERFVGVSLRHRQVEFGPVQRNLRRTSFAGKRALSWGALGFIKETVDGGITWRDRTLPELSASDELPRTLTKAGLPRVGCSDVGCRLAGGVRLGWDGAFGALAPSELELLPNPPTGAGRYHMSCAGILPAPGAAPVANRRDGSKAPKEPVGQRALEMSFEDPRALLEVEGATSALFDREAKVRLTYWDRFRVIPHRTLAMPAVFASRVAAEEAFGFLDPLASSRSLTLLGDGRGGLIELRVRERSRVLTFLDQGPVTLLELPPFARARSLLGVTDAYGAFMTALKEPGKLVVLRAGGGRFQRAFEIPLDFIDGYEVLWVQDDSGTPGVFVEGDRGWFVFPVQEGGSVGPPHFASHQGSRPRSCGPGDHGFAITREFPITPHIESGGQVLDVGNVWARHLLGQHGVCLDSLSVRARGRLELEPTLDGAPDPRGVVPLTVLDAEGIPLGELICR